MKKLSFVFFALAACIHLSATPLLNILQVECVRKGTYAYKPNSALPFTDLTSEGTKEVDPYFSDHATTVANYWQAGGTASLVKTWFICELSNFDMSLVLPAHTPQMSAAKGLHLVIIPGGESWEAVSNVAITKLQGWAASQNALVIKSPPDAGQGFFQSPCQAVGANILTVASSTTGSDMANQPPVDVYFPQDWNSYAQPVIIESGVARIIDWLLQNGIGYSAADLRLIIIATAQKDAQGRPIFNGGAALAAVKAKYSGPIAPPLPPAPIVAPVITPVPTTTIPPTPVATATPVPTPTPVTTTDNLPPQINSWGSWNSAWSSPANPTTFHWIATHCISVMITDPNGKTIIEPPTGTLTVSTPCSGYTWTLKATNAGVTVTSKPELVHGCL